MIYAYCRVGYSSSMFLGPEGLIVLLVRILGMDLLFLVLVLEVMRAPIFAGSQSSSFHFRTFLILSWIILLCLSRTSRAQLQVRFRPSTHHVSPHYDLLLTAN